MKSSIFLLCCLICSLAHAQFNLSGSRISSTHRYIYKVTDKEALELYRQHKKTNLWANEKYLHTLVGSFADSLPFPAGTSAGNYLVVNASGNNLVYDFHPVENVQLKVVTNNYDLAILLHDINGVPVSNAVVQVNKRRIPWDERTSTYRLARYKGTGIVQVYYNNVLNIFKITAEKNPYQRSRWQKLRAHLHKKENKYRSRPDFRERTVTENHYKGFMAFNKPMYKPGDTVRLKAFIVKNNGKPVNEPLLLRLSDRFMQIDTILATITPYRPGGYDFEFVLKNGRNDTVAVASLTLPAMLPVHPYVQEYKVTAAGFSNTFSTNNERSAVSCQTNRTRDSVFVEIENPRKLSFWYSIFAGNKLIDRGYGSQLSWKSASITDKNYFVSLQYVWNDQVKNDHIIRPGKSFR